MACCCDPLTHAETADAGAPRHRPGAVQLAVWLLILSIRGYRLFLSPWTGHDCRFQPTCSAYAIEALERHGPLRGLGLTVRRLSRCAPWGGSGFNPVPQITNRKTEP